ncbi:MAG: putative Fe-S cluster protein YjdI/Zn-finger domain of CDGSH type-containing protein [Chloroflexi bacterium]|jgi:CDGSH-type Zn-finger protein|nr:MAG: putative Fe-S cluster protein YjdI/Zn-finger domain of CDGSH type-containing protein [Chloroflexota bacterium]
MVETKSITPSENGPYFIEGAIAIRGTDGQNLAEGKERVLLCRCGGSANKPFCDGTHRNGFEGTEVADRGPIASRRVAFKAPGITIFDDRSICAHSGNCTDNLTKVFKLGIEPWIDPTGEAPSEIARVVNMCPSGALSYVLDDTAGPDATPTEVARPQEVTPLKNGPYAVTGGISATSPSGEPYEIRDRCTLCRCGASTNKPFCSGAHWDKGFEAEGV